MNPTKGWSPDVVDLAWQIVNMDMLIQRQNEEIERLKDYEKNYLDLLDSSLKHNQDMIGNTLKILLNPSDYSK